ncbi:GCN5-related N-acetyltransferase [Paenibacillus curdlanolyticus YK9]|uniref:GCN5-related N-acetyltransferase n=1 Tax=Paenibacillus curdlanolyticus YK9 TaxID=717606 RepID=E0IGF9_9BACL|nr:GNAT family N-acetyltransferase [Paenibacillus curdlanolyticus]EFM08459.1 GCN5-related N-acetyltransferase [Paenibacillus curdlanolyticus YK9]
MINIRSLMPDDLQACVRLYMDVFNAEPWNDEWTEERAAEHLTDFTNMPRFKGIVAVQGEVLQGFIFGSVRKWWQGDEFFINEMCVRTDVQRAGIGTSLMRHLEQVMKEEGVRNLALLTDRGMPAEFFYKKYGFEEISRIMFLTKDVE